MADSTVADFKTAYPKMCADAMTSLDARAAGGDSMFDAWNNSVNGIWLHDLLRRAFPASAPAARAAIGERLSAGLGYQGDKTHGRASAQEIIDGDALLETLATDVRAVVSNPFV